MCPHYLIYNAAYESEKHENMDLLSQIKICGSAIALTLDKRQIAKLQSRNGCFKDQGVDSTTGVCFLLFNY